MSANYRNQYRPDSAGSGQGGRPGWGLEDNGDPRVKQIMQISQESSERTRNMLRTATETDAMGRDTLVALQGQTEQLQRVNKDLDDINDTMNFTDRTLRGMESVFGSVANFFTKGKSKPGAEAAQKKQKEKEEQARAERERHLKETTAKTSKAGSARNQPPASTYGQPRTALDEHVQAHMKQQDEDLDRISDLIGGLKNMGKDMNYELGKQSGLIDEVTDKTDGLHGRINTSNRRIRKML